MKIARSEFNNDKDFSAIRAEFSETVNESLRIEIELGKLNRQTLNRELIKLCWELQTANRRFVTLNRQLKDYEAS